MFGIHDFIKEEVVKEADADALLYPAVLHIPVDLLRESFATPDKEMPFCVIRSQRRFNLTEVYNTPPSRRQKRNPE